MKHIPFFMALVVIGPVTKDLIVIGDESSQKIGGATYYQSFVFEEFYKDYLAIVNCGDDSLICDFPNLNKVKVISKDNTHYFINKYPHKDNLDIREQVSNFAQIPILKSDLENVLPDKIDAFVLNPLNRYDFPKETLEYLKTFKVPIFISIQGFLRVPDDEVNENYTIKLEGNDELKDVLRGVNAIFLDEEEAEIMRLDFDVVDEIVVTNASHGSRIITDKVIKIDAVNCDNVVDTTGCGDTYMAAYISQRLLMKSPKNSGDFASEIASHKIRYNGPYKLNR